MTQNNQVLAHIRAHGSISQLEAFGLYSIFRLAAVIHSLKKDGWHFRTEKKSVDANGTVKPYVRYYFTHAQKIAKHKPLGELRREVAQQVPEKAAEAEAPTPAFRAKVGDRVRVVKKVTHEKGWNNVWVLSMGALIGKEFTVKEVHPAGVYFVRGSYLGFPHGSLELVPNEPSGEGIDRPTPPVYSPSREVGVAA